MSLFNPKRCVICGGRLGRYPSELADGNLCTACTDKVSYHLNGLSSRTTAEMGAHLEYRAQNMRLLSDFRESGCTGGYDYLHVDKTNRLWTVSLGTNSLKDFPDVFTFDQLVGFYMDIKDENGSTTSTNRNIAGDTFRHRATCRFTAPPELPIYAGGTYAQAPVPAELRYLNDGERDTWISVYAYLSHPWISFIRIFVTKRPCGCYGTHSYNAAAETARSIIAVFKEILGERGSGIGAYTPPPQARRYAPPPPRGATQFYGPNPMYVMPAPPTSGYYQAAPNPYLPLPGTAPIPRRNSAPVDCPVCGAKGQIGEQCEYCGTNLK